MVATIRTIIGLWFVVLTILMLVPVTSDPTWMGEQRIRAAIDLSLLCWGAAAFFLLMLRRNDWAEGQPLVDLARCLWILAIVTYLVHVAMAFHYYHGWSHNDAFDRTDRMTGFGAGIYVSYGFTLIWLMDGLAWLATPGWYARRSPWFDRILHTFMAFILFNGAVVYAAGPVRWISLGGFVFLGVVLLFRWFGSPIPFLNKRNNYAELFAFRGMPRPGIEDSE